MCMPNWVEKFFLYVAVLVPLVFSSSCFCSDLDDAMEKYIQAEQATVRVEKESLLNEALKVFLSYANEDPSGNLLYNIGSLYAQLGDYGMAIAFFRKAEKLIPRDTALQVNMARVIDLAHVNGYQIEYPVIDAICFKWCSPLERKLFLVGGAAFAFLFFSLNLWLPMTGFRWLSRFAMGCTLLLSLLFLSHHYLLPPRAVVVKTSALRVAEADANGAKLILHPGEMVEILYFGGKNDPVRVRTATALSGYLPRDVLFVVE